jgi:hypothetical protein
MFVCKAAILLELFAVAMIGYDFLAPKKQYRWLERKILEMMGYFPIQGENETPSFRKNLIGPALVACIILIGLILYYAPRDIASGAFSLSEIATINLITLIGAILGILVIGIVSYMVTREATRRELNARFKFELSYWTIWIASILLTFIAMRAIPLVPRLFVSLLIGFAAGVLLLPLVFLFSLLYRPWLIHKTFQKRFIIAKFGFTFFVVAKVIQFACF